MSVQDRWNTIEDAAAALVNKARLRKGMADTNQEWEFLLAAALALALESYDLGVKAAFVWHTDRLVAWIEQYRTLIERLAQGEPAKGRADTHTSPQTTQDATSGTGKHEAGT